MEQIIIFGASNYGKKAYNFYKNECEILCFLDNDKNKWNKDFCGIKVIAPDMIKGELLDKKIIISSSWSREISEQLQNMGAVNVYIFSANEEKVWTGNIRMELSKRVLSLGKFLGDEPLTFRTLSFTWGGSGVLDYALLRQLAIKYKLKNYLEIGTYIGDSLKNLSDICQKCYSISVPEDHPAHMKYWCEKKGMQDYSGRLIDENNMISIQCDSRLFNYRSIPDKIDLVFIDGDHSYEGVLSDTINIFDIVDLSDTFIVWHDCRKIGELNMEVLTGIKDGMNELFENFYVFDNNNCGIYIPDKYLTDFIEAKPYDFYTYEIQVRSKKYD